MKHDRGIGPVPDGLERLDPDGWLAQIRRFMLDLQFGRVQALAGSSSTGTGGTPAPSPAGAPGPPGAPGAPDTPDLTPPPTPTGFTALAGLDFVGFTTDAPTFSMGHGYMRTIIYGATYSGSGPLPTFSGAVIVHEFVGQVGTMDSEPKTRWHLWAKWRTRDGVLSISPAGGTNGVQVTTGNDVTKLLEALTGQITQSQLYATLGTRINLIDDPDTVPGSVNARVKTEQVARTSADSALSSTLTTVSATTTANAAAIVTETTARAAGDSANASQITTLQSQIATAGANVLKNSGFEVDSDANGQADDWTLFTGGVGDPGRVHVLSRPGPLSGSGFSQRVQITSTTTGADSGLLQTVSPINAGTKWAAAADLRSNSNGAYVLLRFIGSYGVLDAQSAYTTAGAATVRLSVTGTAPTGTTDVQIHFRGISGAGEWFEVDNAQLEQSATPTGYKPGIGDFQGTYAALQTEASTRASADGYLGAQWTVRMTVGNIVGGLGLSGTSAPGAGATIDFGIRANRFYIAAPEGVSGVSSIIPFAVQTTPTTTAAGEVLPAGVYMDAAYVRNLEVVLGRFNTAIITNAMVVSLSATKITAGSLAVGEYIQSSAFTPGGTGFRIDGGGGVEIRNSGDTRVLNLGASGTQPILKAGSAFEVLANGNATFAGSGSFAGTITATAGSIGGIAIDSTGIQSSNYVSGTSGFRLAANGAAQLPSAAILGSLSSLNIVGAASVDGFNNISLTVSGGAISEDVFSPDFVIETVPSGATAALEATFAGSIRIGLNSSFAGGGGTYSVEVGMTIVCQAWNGSAWVGGGFTPIGSGVIAHRSPMVLTGSEQIYIPMAGTDVTKHNVSGIFSGFTKMRLQLQTYVFIRQLAVNGGALKTDALAGATLYGNYSLKQLPL